MRDGASRVDFERDLAVFRKPRDMPGGRTPESYDWMQQKIDGIRLLVTHEHALTTRPTDIRAQYPDHPVWSHARRCMRDLDHDAWLDCELYVPGSGAEAVKTGLARGTDNLRLAAFGASILRPEDKLDKASAVLVGIGLNVPHLHPVGWFASDMRAPHSDGVVYKSLVYGEWARVKNRKTIDLLVTGIAPGVGKYTGQCGALRCSGMVNGKLEEICRVSGMADDVRAGISSADIGRVVEVAYERVGSRGRLRHPRFVRWRDDKSWDTESSESATESSTCGGSRSSGAP